MPNGIKPFPVPNRLTIYETHDVGVVPSFVGGSASDFICVLALFENYIPDKKDVYNGKPHVSDMTILRRCKGMFDVVPMLRHYGDPDWREAKAVHFPHIAAKGESKVKLIERELPMPQRIEVIHKVGHAPVDPTRKIAILHKRNGKKPKETRDQMLARMAKVRAARKSK